MQVTRKHAAWRRYARSHKTVILESRRITAALGWNEHQNEKKKHFKYVAFFVSAALTIPNSIRTSIHFYDSHQANIYDGDGYIRK